MWLRNGGKKVYLLGAMTIMLLLLLNSVLRDEVQVDQNKNSPAHQSDDSVKKVDESTDHQLSSYPREVISNQKLKSIDETSEGVTTEKNNHKVTTEKNNQHSTESDDGRMPIDAVYLWVNGSDPEFIKKLNHFKPIFGGGEPISESSVGKFRFSDNGELFYSLRSLNMYAPWIRNVYIVSSDGQVPSWMDLSNPRLRIVPDHTIFANRSHTPTFSSPAIELNMYNIPGLSDNFIEFNDDWYLGQTVTREDFITPSGAYKIRHAWPAPTTCKPDLDNYGKSLCHVNNMYNNLYGRTTRKVIAHAPHLFNRNIIRDFRNTFKEEVEKTSSGHFRGPDDLQFQFAYFYFLIHEPRFHSIRDLLSVVDTNVDKIITWEELSYFLDTDPNHLLSERTVSDLRNSFIGCQTAREKTDIDINDVIACNELKYQLELKIVKANKYKHETASEDDVHFKALKNDIPEVTRTLSEIRSNPRLFVSLNDDRDHDQANDVEISKIYNDFLDTMYPVPSPFELPEGKHNEFFHLRDFNS